MTDVMSDRDFLLYCETHAETPRCGFTPDQIARLFRLAGNDNRAALWAMQPAGVFNCDPESVLYLVEEARERIGTLS
jgi:hypothetical protein